MAAGRHGQRGNPGQSQQLRQIQTESIQRLSYYTQDFFTFLKSHTFDILLKYVCIWHCIYFCIYSIKYGFGWLNCAISSYIQGNYKKFINFFPITILKLKYQSSLLKFLCHTIKPHIILVFKILFFTP